MTTADMLADLRSLLDEDVAQFWSDTLDCYPALSDGQKEYAAIVLAQYKARALLNPSESIPEVLRPLYIKVSGTTSFKTIDLPSDFMYDISMYLGGSYNRPLMKRELSRTILFDQNNSYMGTQGYYYSIINTAFSLEIPTPANLDYVYEYIKSPAAISATVEPILPEFTRSAIVRYAYAQCLKKSKQYQEAIAQYQEFLSNVKYL